MSSFAPIFSKPLKWRFTGRAPIAHPPGVDTRALPSRASSGPSDRKDARIVLTSSYGASRLVSDVCRELDGVALEGAKLGAEILQQSNRRTDVGELGDVAEPTALARE